MDANTIISPAISTTEPLFTEQRVFRIANNLQDREGAFRLLHQAYVRSGLTEPKPHGLRVSPYQLLPTSSVIVAEVNREIVSTVSMVMDGDLGLPIEGVYPEAVAQLRRFGARCAEICCLADRRADPERGVESIIELTRLAFYKALEQKVTCLLLIAHPRHARFYKRAMGFQAFDEVRTCPYVRNRPAEPLLLNMLELAYRRPRLYDRYLGESVEEDRLRQTALSPNEVAYFRRFL